MSEPALASGAGVGAHGPGGTGARGPGGTGAHGLGVLNTAAPSPRSPRLVAPWGAFRRPLWLLPAPQQLEEIEGVPRRRGTLRFFGDVERIETGWWDGGEIGRDYYTVFDIYGVQLWIFRGRADPHRWFLHGVFG